MYICELLFVQLECFDCCGVVDDVKPKLKFTEGCEGVKPIKKKPLRLCGGYGCCRAQYYFMQLVYN